MAPIEKIPRPDEGDRRVIRDMETFTALKETLDTKEAVLVPFDTDSNTARNFRARFWREGLRLRVWRLKDGTHAAWLEVMDNGDKGTRKRKG